MKSGGDGKGNFTYVDQRESGFHLRGDVRSVLNINDHLLFGLNQESIKAYHLQTVMDKVKKVREKY